MHYIPVLHLRVDEETQDAGIDARQIAEPAYNYVSLKPSPSDPVTDDIELDRRGENNWFRF